MSKSMWIDGIECKPVIGDTPFQRDNELSDRVLVWVKEENGPSTGVFYHSSQYWLVEGEIIRSDRIEYFAYIDNPYK